MTSRNHASLELDDDDHRDSGGEPDVVVGIDASRNRSGGAKAHLIGILGDSDPRAAGIRLVHVWTYEHLLAALPERPWLVTHTPAELEGNLVRQLYWQWRQLPAEARAVGCQILLNTDAGSVCPFRPAVVMSRDMLSYEPGEMQRYGFSKARLRLLVLKHVQNRSLRFADGAVFLTRYASRVIQQSTGPLPKVAIIPHGVGRGFKNARPCLPWPASNDHPVECLYVSNTAMYKHQWNVVQAVAALRERGHNLRLTLAGGGNGKAQRRLDQEIRRTDPEHKFVREIGHVNPADLPKVLQEAHIFIFASSCENMPNTLVEGMAAGLPIACSRRGPMPEVLEDGGVYFDPEDPAGIAEAVEQILTSPELRLRIASRAAELAERYSWARCGQETWAFLRQCLDRHLA